MSRTAQDSPAFLGKPAPPGQCWDIMAQIRIDAFHREGVIFVVHVKDMFPRKDHIQISAVPICAVYFRIGSRVYHPLNRSGRLIPTYNMPHNLPGLSTRHRHNVNIFPRFSPGLVLRDQYSSSSSTTLAPAEDSCLLFLRALFFYPIHYIGFVHPQNFPTPRPLTPAVVHFDCQFSGFFRVCVLFRIYGVIFAALLTLAALAP